MDHYHHGQRTLFPAPGQIQSGGPTTDAEPQAPVPSISPYHRSYTPPISSIPYLREEQGLRSPTPPPASLGDDRPWLFETTPEHKPLWWGFRRRTTCSGRRRPGSRSLSDRYGSEELYDAHDDDDAAADTRRDDRVGDAADQRWRSAVNVTESDLNEWAASGGDNPQAIADTPPAVAETPPAVAGGFGSQNNYTWSARYDPGENEGSDQASPAPSGQDDNTGHQAPNAAAVAGIEEDEEAESRGDDGDDGDDARSLTLEPIPSSSAGYASDEEEEEEEEEQRSEPDCGYCKVRFRDLLKLARDAAAADRERPIIAVSGDCTYDRAAADLFRRASGSEAAPMLLVAGDMHIRSSPPPPPPPPRQKRIRDDSPREEERGVKRQRS